jgi:D-alanyl-D-alanine dipeptidase
MMITNFQLLGIVLLLTSCANSNISKIHNLGAPLAEVNSMLPASVPPMELEIRYSTSNNFVGEPISGYGAARALLSIEAVQALSKVQIQLTKKGMGLKIFDAYRPQRAVDHFVRWATDIEDNAKKQQYYPNVKKSNLFREGYIAKQSGHSR